MSNVVLDSFAFYCKGAFIFNATLLSHVQQCVCASLCLINLIRHDGFSLCVSLCVPLQVCLWRLKLLVVMSITGAVAKC